MAPDRACTSAPAVALYVVFVIVPVVQAVHYSFYSWTGSAPLTDFIGLGQLPRGVRRPRVPAGDGAQRDPRRALARRCSFRSRSASRCCSTGRCAAAASLRLIFFAPYVLSEAITAIVFLQILQPDGLVDATLQARRARRARPALARRPRGSSSTRSSSSSRGSTSASRSSSSSPACRAFPRELHEAAAIDGATSWATLRYVTLPLLGPTIRIWAFLSIIGSIQLFDLVWIMTAGGPAGASSTMATYMVDQGVNSLRIGYATAVAVILFLICFVFSILYQIFVLRRDIAGARRQDGRLMATAQPAAPARSRRSRTRRSTSSRSRSARRDRADRVRRAQRLPHHRPDRRRPGRRCRTRG